MDLGADAKRHVWPAIAAVTAVTVAWMGLAGLRLDWESAVLPALVGLGLEALAAFYTFIRPDPRLAATLSGLAQIVVFSAVAACLSYAAAGTAGPLWDEQLLSWDRALGLDWRGYLDFLDDHPRLGLVLTLSYQSLKAQLVVVLAVLGFSGRLRAMRSFLLAFVITAVVTILGSGLLPAMGTFFVLKLQPQDFPHLHPAAAYLHVAILEGLRAGTFRVISLWDAQGIITFPSFHAALAMVVTLALWPVRWIRWPTVGLNALLIAATPINGGHYFVDVLAGSVIAVLATIVARWATATPMSLAIGAPAWLWLPKARPVPEP